MDGVDWSLLRSAADGCWLVDVGSWGLQRHAICAAAGEHDSSGAKLTSCNLGIGKENILADGAASLVDLETFDRDDHLIISTNVN